MSQQIWTQDEENILISHLGKMSISAIALKMKRSYDSVKNKATRYGVDIKQNKWPCILHPTTKATTDGYCAEVISIVGQSPKLCKIYIVGTQRHRSIVGFQVGR